MACPVLARLFNRHSIVVALVLVVLIGLAVRVAALRHREPPIAQNSVLASAWPARCRTTCPTIPSEILWGTDQSLSNLVLQFKKAKVDNRIKAILLEVNMSGAGLGKAEEIRDAIADFRTSGNLSILHRIRDEQGVLHCQRVRQDLVAPPGELFINGFAADVSFSAAHSTSWASILTSIRLENIRAQPTHSLARRCQKLIANS